MASELAGGALVSSSIKVVCERLSSDQVLSLFRERNLDERLLNNLENKLKSTEVLAVDAEQKQSRDTHVKEWLVAVKDVVFEVEDVLDQIDYAVFECKVEAESQKVRNFDIKIKLRISQVLQDLEGLARGFSYRGLEEAGLVDIGYVPHKTPFGSSRSSVSSHASRIKNIPRSPSLSSISSFADQVDRMARSTLLSPVSSYADQVNRMTRSTAVSSYTDQVDRMIRSTAVSSYDADQVNRMTRSTAVSSYADRIDRIIKDEGTQRYPCSEISVPSTMQVDRIARSTTSLSPVSSFADIINRSIREGPQRYPYSPYSRLSSRTHLMALSKLPSYNLELTDCVLGRQKEKDQVVEFLLDLSDDDNTNANMSILGIVGPGGIGKTTLVCVLCENHKVRTQFELKVWVTFSSCIVDARTLAKSILRILQVSFDQDDHLLDPLSQLQESLNGKRLLLVLDNSSYVHEWEKLLTCFKSTARGSAIILTTRETETAFQMLADHVMQLSFLSIEHCWSLFSDHCFGSQSLSCSPQMEVAGKRILNKCGCVPLAAKMLGGLLHKKDYMVWEEIWRSQQWDSSNINLPAPFVRLCYLDLPLHLKRCITYLAMFPKGYKFQRGQVVRMWITKGLIRGGKSESMKKLGNEYFDCLVARSFLIRSNIGSNMDFTMHDMVHDLALFVSAKLYSVIDQNDLSIDPSIMISNIANVEETSSKLYNPEMKEDIPLKDYTDFVNITPCLDQQFPKIEVNIPTTTNDAAQNKFELETHFETLRILDASQLLRLPPTLHSLRIEGCHSLESLQDVLMKRSTNLFELYIIDCCSLKHFTDGWYPTSLKTLYVHKCKKLEFIVPLEKIQSFELLEHLFMGNSYDSLKSFPLNLFPKLKILCIWDCPNLESLSVEECQNNNLSLESLEIWDCSNLVSFPIKGLFSPNLRSLSVSNCKNLRSLPNHMTSLTSLQSLFVIKCPELDSLPVGGLPSCLKLLSIALCDKLIPQKEWNLQTLHCLHRFEIESGCVGMKSFPEKDLLPVNLNSLYISKLPSLEALDHNGLQQLTALESLEINCCKKLYSLPEVLPSLNFLCIKESSMLSQKLLNQASADWLKIAHICNIQIDNNVTSRNSTGASFLSRNWIPVSSNAKRTSHQ